MRAVAAADVDLRLGVDWRAARRTGGRGSPARLPCLQQRAIVAARGALGQHVDRGVEPDGNRALVEQFAGAWIDEGAAAGGDDPDVAIDQPRDQPALAVAEIMFAIAFEQTSAALAPAASSIATSLSTNGRPRRLRQAPADGRLAGAHQADEHDRSIEMFDQLFTLSDPFGGAIHRACKVGQKPFSTPKPKRSHHASRPDFPDRRSSS